MCLPFASFPGFRSSGLLAWIAFDPIFRNKVVEMGRAYPRKNFHLRFVTFYLLQLSINRVFCVNGKQPIVPFSQKLFTGMNRLI